MLIESVLYSNQPLSAGQQAFRQDFEIGSPNFMQAEDAMLLGGSGEKAFPPENFVKLKPLRCDFRGSDSCKRCSIYLLNRTFSLIILLSYSFLNLPCLTLNYIWDRNSSCDEE